MIGKFITSLLTCVKIADCNECSASHQSATANNMRVVIRLVSAVLIVGMIGLNLSCSSHEKIYYSYNQFRYEMDTANCIERKRLLLGLVNREDFDNSDVVVRFYHKDPSGFEARDTLTVAIKYALESVGFYETRCKTYLHYGSSHYPVIYNGKTRLNYGVYFVTDYVGLKTCLADSVYCR